MWCPNCKGRSLCPCKHCAERQEHRLEPKEVWLDNEVGLIACGHCGFAMILDAWFTMDCDMHMPSENNDNLTPEEAIERYRPMGKMPGEKGYGISFRAHWQVRLWRWRGIMGHTLPLLVGRGKLYGKTRRSTILAQLSKF